MTSDSHIYCSQKTWLERLAVEQFNCGGRRNAGWLTPPMGGDWPVDMEKHQSALAH